MPGSEGIPSTVRASAAVTTDWVEIRNLSFRRGSRPILEGVDLAVPRGKITAIMGPSGCGKTTLLRLIGRQLRPAAGSIQVAGVDIAGLSRTQLFEQRRRMGMLFQNGALFSDLTLFENVAFPLRVHTALPQSMIRDLVLMKLEAVGLRGARDLMPSELSGGMARRAALARAIILDPDLIMYDEPFSGQDPISMGVLRLLIRSVNEALHSTTIIVSHDINETLSISDYVYVLAAGRVIGHGPPDEVVASDDPQVRQFLRGMPDGPVPFHYPAPGYLGDLQLGRD